MSDKSTNEDSTTMANPQEATTITSKLFPELAQNTEEAASVAESAEKEKKTEEDSQKYLDDLDAKVKIKVDGKEDEVTLAEMKKNYQIARHLTLKSQALAEKEKQLAQRESGIDDSDIDDYDADSTLSKELDAIKRELESYAPVMTEIRYKNDLKTVADRVRQEGFDDFMKYVPDIERQILDADDVEREGMMNLDYFEKAYKTLKLKELSGKPHIIDSERKKPNVNVESSNYSSEFTETAASTEKKKLRDEAMKSGDWAAYLGLINNEGRLMRKG